MPAHALLPAVNRLLQQVEEVSGLPVEVFQQGPPIAYSDADEACSYHVAFGAALLLRIVQVPPEQRLNLTEKREPRAKVVAQVEKLFKALQPFERIDQQCFIAVLSEVRPWASAGCRSMSPAPPAASRTSQATGVIWPWPA